MNERGKFAMLVAVFLAIYFVPWDGPTVRNAGLESFLMLQEYAREHVLFCLVPAFFIAGAISVFVSQSRAGSRQDNGEMNPFAANSNRR